MLTTDHRTMQEIQIMSASGWTLVQRRPDGADFTSGNTGSGISAGVHLVLLVLTLGLWLPIMVLTELVGYLNTGRFCRLTFDAYGRPRYENMRRLA